MKKIFLLVFVSLTLFSCAQQDLRHPKWAYDATIYELNTRQATPEGTFQAAEDLLPQLRANGIDIIWVMPCQPIGVKSLKLYRFNNAGLRLTLSLSILY